MSDDMNTGNKSGSEDNKIVKNELTVDETRKMIESEVRSSTIGGSSSIQKLNGADILPWKRQISIILKLRGLLNAISDEDVDETKDMKAVLLLLETMDEAHKIQVQAEPTARKIMLSLEQQYASSSENNLHCLLSTYFNFKKNPADSIFQHVGKLKELRARLASLREIQSDNMFQVNLINSLREGYKDVMLTWNSTPPTLKTTELLINILQEREEMNKVSQEKNAFFVKKDSGQNSGIKRMSPKEIEERKKNSFCGNCGIKGHWWRECKNPPRSTNDKGLDKVEMKARPNFSGNVDSMGLEIKDKWLADTGATAHM